MYDPTIGRWTSQDPLGFDAGDGNLYRYVHNMATTRTDPSGLMPNQKSALDRVQVFAMIQEYEDRNPSKSAYENIVDLQTFQKTSDNPLDGGFNHLYVYSPTYWWIDLGHFINCAKIAYAPMPTGPIFAGWAKTGGEFCELYQSFSRMFGNTHANGASGNASSAYTPEDRISNALGASFGNYLAQLCNRDPNTKLSAALDTFFVAISVGWKTDDPYFHLLPPHELAWQQWVRYDMEQEQRFGLPGIWSRFIFTNQQLRPNGPPWQPPAPGAGRPDLDRLAGLEAGGFLGAGIGISRIAGEFLQAVPQVFRH